MQTLKPEKREAIIVAARIELLKGRDASMESIARRAGVSTGLVYRYFADKDSLYEAAVPRADVATFKKLLLGRARAVGTPAYPELVAQLQRFSETHREQVIIAVRDELFDDLVSELVQIASAHVDPEAATVLPLIYRSFLQNVLTLLEARQSVEAYARYHLAGLRGVLARAD